MPELPNPNLDLEVLQKVWTAFRNDDAAELQQLLERHPVLKLWINEPHADFDSPLIVQVRSQAMLDVLLAAGADINARSKWWAGGFGLLDCADEAAQAGDTTVEAGDEWEQPAQRDDTVTAERIQLPGLGR